MKRFTFSVVVTAVLGLAAYSLAGAQPERRGPASGSPGFQDGQRPAGPGRGFGPRGGGMPGLRGIELTDDQKAQIRAIHEEAAQAQAGSDPAGVEPGQRRGRGPRGGGAEAALHQQLHAELLADTPDAQKIAALQQQVMQAHAARLSQQIAVQQRIAQVLTAEQREQLRQRLTERPGRRAQRP